MDHVSNGIRILEFFSHTIEAWQGDVISNVHDTADFSLAEAWTRQIYSTATARANSRGAWRKDKKMTSVVCVLRTQTCRATRVAQLKVTDSNAMRKWRHRMDVKKRLRKTIGVTSPHFQRVQFIPGTVMASVSCLYYQALSKHLRKWSRSWPFSGFIDCFQ